MTHLKLNLTKVTMFWLVPFFSGVLVFAGEAPVPQNFVSCGFLLIAQGTVEILRQHPSNDADSVRHYMPGEKSTPLSCEDVVVTREASNATIQVSRGKITIGPNSRVEIAKFSGPAEKPEVNMIDLVYGKVRALVTKKPGTGDEAYFRIKTPVAVT